MHQTPAMPSQLLRGQRSRLRIEKCEELASVARKADEWQKKHIPGKPSVTMAAFIYLNQDRLGIRRYMKEIAITFDCDPDSVKHRVQEIQGKRRD